MWRRIFFLYSANFTKLGGTKHSHGTADMQTPIQTEAETLKQSQTGKSDVQNTSNQHISREFNQLQKAKKQFRKVNRG
jgi:hypothetical protein